MRKLTRLGVAVVLAGATTGIGYAVDGSDGRQAQAASVAAAEPPTTATPRTGPTTPQTAPTVDGLGPGLVTVRMGIHHSAFSRSVIRVEPGTLVRFVVVNGDPIAHELVVAPAQLSASRAVSGPPR